MHLLAPSLPTINMKPILQDDQLKAIAKSTNVQAALNP